MSREKNLIKRMQRMERKAQPQTPLSNDMFIPNHSGDHQAGKVYKTPVSDYDIANKKYVDENAGAGASALSDLTDVDASVATPSDGDIIVYRAAGSDWVLEAKPAGGSNPALADITDVTITTVGDNDIIAWDSGTSRYTNQTAAEAGLASASHTHTLSDVTDVTSTAAELNILDGATLTTTELNYVDGVTSAIQTQLNGKASSSHTHSHTDITDFDAEVQALSINNLSEDSTPSLSATLDASDNNITNIKLAEFQDEHDNGNSGTSDTIDWGQGNNQKSTLTGNVTFTFTAPSGASRLQLKLIQDATGSRTVTWPTINWAGSAAPTLSTAANAVDIVTLFYDGTNYYGVGSLNFS